MGHSSFGLSVGCRTISLLMDCLGLCSSDPLRCVLGGPGELACIRQTASMRFYQQGLTEGSLQCPQNHQVKIKEIQRLRNSPLGQEHVCQQETGFSPWNQTLLSICWYYMLGSLTTEPGTTPEHQWECVGPSRQKQMCESRNRCSVARFISRGLEQRVGPTELLALLPWCDFFPHALEAVPVPVRSPWHRASPLYLPFTLKMTRQVQILLFFLYMPTVFINQSATQN